LAEEGLLERRQRLGTIVRCPEKNYMENIGFYYFSENIYHMLCAADGLQKQLAVHGCDLKLIPFEEDFYGKVDLLDDIRMRRLKGAVLVALRDEECLRQFQCLEKAGFPFVRFGNKYFDDRLNSPLVTGNEAQGMDATLDYLESKGHRKIGFIFAGSDKESDNVYADRISKKDYFQERWRMVLKFSKTIEKWRKMEHAPRIIRSFLSENRDLTALSVEDACVCIETHKQAAELGIKIPEDLSLMVLRENSYLFEAHNLNVSSMFLPYDKMISNTVNLLLKTINKESCVRRVNVEYEMNEKKSVANIPLMEVSCVD
jgi:DNA-binding LacI/PurR family transcriptional regulator